MPTMAVAVALLLLAAPSTPMVLPWPVMWRSHWQQQVAAVQLVAPPLQRQAQVAAAC